jgi:F-type H+-transporting ATPase subunit epsilon
MSTIRLQVISLQGVFLDEMVDFFKFGGPQGQIGILKNHAPLLTIMSAGTVTYQTQSSSKTFHTLGGVVEFRENKALLLADYCSTECSDFLRLQAREKAKKHDEEKQKIRSFHQLYAELVRSPAEVAALKGLGQRHKKNKDL